MTDAMLAHAAGIPVDWDEVFEGAAMFVQTAMPQAAGLAATSRLKLYALFKQATEGDNMAPAPGLLSFDLKAKAKWCAASRLVPPAVAQCCLLLGQLAPRRRAVPEQHVRSRRQAWSALKGINQQGAMQSYVMLVEELFPEWQDGGGAGEKGRAFAAPITSTLAGGEAVHGTDEVRAASAVWCASRITQTESASSHKQVGAATLHSMSGQGDVKAVQRLLDGGADVNARDEDGAALLHWACDRGATEMAAHLLSQGADVAARDDAGMTPLHYAAVSEHAEVRGRVQGPKGRAGGVVAGGVVAGGAGLKGLRWRAGTGRVDQVCGER